MTRITVALMFSLLSLIGCKKETMSKYPEYRWLVSESAPKEYPMQIIDGDFEALDGYHKGIPTRVLLYDGWGEGRSWMATGREEMPAPKSMAVTWYSYREDTFYRGEFALPVDQITELFNSHKPQPFTSNVDDGGVFVVGLAPEGFVVVWLFRRGSGRVVFTGFAKPVDDVPPETIFDYPDMTREQVREMIIREVMEEAKDSPNLHNPKYWQQLHSELYTYDYVIESPYTPYKVTMSFLDKTSDGYYGDELDEFSKIKRSVPISLSLTMLFPDRYSTASVSFRDSNELYAAIRHLSKDADAGRLRVVVKVEGDLYNWQHQVKIRVENDKEAIAIKQFEFSPHGGTDLMQHLEHNKHMQQFVNQLLKPAQP